MLSFATREDYDRTIENLAQIGDENFEAWENDLGFTSMRSIYDTDQLMKRGLSDPLLATIINPLGMIEIAGNIFKLDMLAQKVVMIPTSEYGIDGFSSKAKRLFSTNDNILDILDGTAEASETARRYCRSQLKTSSVRVDVYRYRYVMEYRRAGFLNTLRAIIAERPGNNPRVSVDIKTLGKTFYRSKTRCINENNRKSRYDRIRKYSYIRLYNSSRRLKAYDFAVEFRVIVNSGTTYERTETKPDRITCGSQTSC